MKKDTWVYIILGVLVFAGAVSYSQLNNNGDLNQAILTSDGQNPENAVDGDLSTFWTAPYNDYIELNLDFGTSIFKDKLELVAGSDGNPVNYIYDLQVSDNGVRWTRIASNVLTNAITQNTLFTYSLDSPIKARYWKFGIKTDGINQQPKVHEVMLSNEGKYDSKEQAQIAAKNRGCEGYHEYENKFMPCAIHQE